MTQLQEIVRTFDLCFYRIDYTIGSFLSGVVDTYAIIITRAEIKLFNVKIVA